MFRVSLLLIVFLSFLSFAPVKAQEDALNLPTELYILLNEGRVERYGLGAAGVSTVTPEEDVVIDFGVAPDGVWMSYRTEGDFKLFNMLTGENRDIESGTAPLPPFRGLGQTIAWSPDASVVAYTVENGIRLYFMDNVFYNIPITPILNMMWSPDGTYLAAEAENNVWWVYRRQGYEVFLHSAIVSSVGMAWVDTNVLMIAPETGGLITMDLAQANAQVNIHDESVLFQKPILNDDGQVSVFGKDATDNTLANTSGYLYHVTLGSTSDVELVGQNSLDLKGVTWAPGGRLLTALRGGVLALVEPVSAQGFALPMTGVAAYGWGARRPESAAPFELPETLHFLADDGTGLVQLWRLPRDGSAPVPVTPLENSVELYTFASDGQTLAYVSDDELFVLPAGADEPVALTEAEQTTTLSFSPDLRTIVYDEGANIMTINVGGGEPEVLLEGYSHPRYSPSGDSLLLRLPDNDLGLFRLESGEILRLGTYDDAAWMSDGRIIVYGALTAASSPGLYLYDATGTLSTLLFSPPTGLRIENAVDAGAEQIRMILVREGAPTPLIILDVDINGKLTGQDTPGYIISPQLSSFGRFIAGYADATGALVVVDLENPREIVLRQPPSVKDFRWVSFR